MSEFGQRFRSGIPQAFSAGAMNRLIDKVARPDVQPPNVLNFQRDTNRVQLENPSEAGTLEPFAVQRVADASWNERSDELFISEGMRRGAEIAGSLPVDDFDRIGISQRSVTPMTVEPAVISGPTAVRVLFEDETSLEYPFAVPIPGRSDVLKASPFGKNRILWHSEPSESIEPCEGVILQAYVNMGDDGQWVWFRLLEDLSCCSSAQARLVDQCGNDVGECPIIKTVYGPEGHDLCGCGTCGGWKAGEVLPFWWFQYLEKWITIPDVSAGWVTKEIEVLTGGTFEGLEFTPTGSEVEAVTNVILDQNEIFLETEPQEVNISAEGTISADVEVSGPVQVNGMAVVSGDVSLSGEVNTSVGISGSAELDISAPVEVSGTLNASGSVTLSGGESQEVLQSVTFTPAALAYTSGSIPIISGASFSGSLNENGNVIQRPFTGSVTLDLGELAEALGVDLSGVSVSVSFDFSNCFTSQNVVTDVQLNGCELTYTSAELPIWNGSAPSVNAQLSGAGKLTGSGTFTGSASGTVSIPSEVSGSVTLHSSGTFTASHITNWTPSALSQTKKTLTIPTGGTCSISQEVELSGVLDLSGQSVSLENMTAEVSAPVEVSGPVTLTGENSFSVSEVTLSGTVSAPVSLNTSGTVEVPANVILGENFIRLETDTVQNIELLTGEGTISGGSTETIKYLTCECE